MPRKYKSSLNSAAALCCDSHSHTSFSTDSETAPRDQIQKAIDLGLKHFYITDHMDLGYPDGSFVFDVSDYQKQLSLLKEEYADRIHLHIGIELGLRPEPEIIEGNRRIVTEWPFDIAIGSIHVVDNFDPYYSEYWQSYGEERGILRYYETMLESMLPFDGFDTLGHIDYIVRYCPSKGELLKNEVFSRQVKDHIREVLHCLVQKGKALELNTAGWKYGLPAPHPAPDILKLYHSLGGRKITVGSDGHKPEHIAWDFNRVAHYLRSNGFDEIVRFENHEPIVISLK